MKYSKYLIQTILALSLWGLVGGCRQGSQKQQEITVARDMIVADCIVKYFQTDNAPYITQQQHHFGPSSGYLAIIADEPSGEYKFILKNEQFIAGKQLTPFLSGLSASFVCQPLATAVFYSFTAGAGLLDTASFTPSEAVKIEGQWYQPMQAPQTQGGLQVTLMNNRETNRIELVQLQDSTTKSQWLIQSYNLLYNSELDTLVPMKIDVFDISGGIASKKLIIQIDYKSILKKRDGALVQEKQ